MNTRRTRMLVIVTAAAMVVSFFVRWDEMATSFRAGFKDGWNAAGHAPGRR